MQIRHNKNETVSFSITYLKIWNWFSLNEWINVNSNLNELNKLVRRFCETKSTHFYKAVVCEPSW